MKLVPEATTHADLLEWRPWDVDRKTPFVAHGATGTAWVKVLSRDPDTGAESLLYKLNRGWSAASIENTVFENLMVLHGELEADGQWLRKYAYSYRPEGHTAGPVKTGTGVTVIAFAGAPGDPASKVPLPHVDVERMPWLERTMDLPGALYYSKLLRVDEATLDIYALTRSVCGFETGPEVHSDHDVAEEMFFIEGKVLAYDGPTRGRQVYTPGKYVWRPPHSVHGHVTALEDTLMYAHSFFSPDEPQQTRFLLDALPADGPLAQALRDGRTPELPKRW